MMLGLPVFCFNLEFAVSLGWWKSLGDGLYMADPDVLGIQVHCFPYSQIQD